MGRVIRRWRCKNQESNSQRSDRCIWGQASMPLADNGGLPGEEAVS